jgi:hypothetical protein
MRRLRTWLGSRPWAPGVLGVPVGLWLRLCAATTRWELRGTEEVEAALAGGPVILALWHERIALSGRHWRWGPISALHATRFAAASPGAPRPSWASIRSPWGAARARAPPRARCCGASRPARASASPWTAPRARAAVKDPVLDWARATGRP